MTDERLDGELVDAAKAAAYADSMQACREGIQEDQRREAALDGRVSWSGVD